MSPIEARVLVVEDEPAIQTLVEIRLKGAGHKVVGRASNLSEALETAKHVKELGANVAIVDGNLGSTTLDCKDGRKVAEALREAAPDIRIVAFSNSDPGRADYGDIFVPKKQVRQLGERITSL